MKNLGLRLFVLGGGSALLTTTFLLACSSDDTVVPPFDAGLDGALDSSTQDGQTQDVAQDVRTDAPPFDGGLKVERFPRDVAEAICQSLARCCFGNAGLDGGAPVDGGAYDQASCVEGFTKTGFARSNSGLSDSPTARLVLDQQKGVECLQKLKALSCGAMSAAEHRAAVSACFSAVHGTQIAGQPCGGSAECAAGLYCNKSGAAGVCQAIRSANASCGDTHDPSLADDVAVEFAEHACSYRGGGDTSLFCDWYDFTANAGEGAFRPKGEWKCSAARADGLDCANDSWCAPGVCKNDTFKCGSSDNIFPPIACETYVK